jgi:hypothetical protein
MFGQCTDEHTPMKEGLARVLAELRQFLGSHHA